jgi:hypothetical protein
LDFNFKYIANVNVNDIADKVKSFTDDIWGDYDFRQKTFDTHKDTLTVPLLFEENFSDFPNTYKWYSLFEEQIKSLNNIFLEYYKTGWIARAILVNLPAGKIIPTHIDSGVSLEICHRHHIPIITNNKVSFKVGNEVKYMKEGDIWEINNTNKPHSVYNLGTKDRIHLILDWHR